MASEQLSTLTLTVIPDGDSEDTLRSEIQLRRELEELDLTFVASPSTEAPLGTRSADVGTLGQILIALSATGGVLTSLIALAKDHLDRTSGTIVVKIGDDELTIPKASDDTQTRLVSAFIARHQGS